MPTLPSIIAAEFAPWWVAMSVAGAVAWVAWRSGSLRPDGAVAAFAAGVLALRVQWSWGAYLILWFVLASLLSRIGQARKAQRTHETVAKTDRRDAWQVLANGGVFSLCALVVLAARYLAPDSIAGNIASVAAVAAAGALAASGSDTWSTEVGTLLGGSPWSLRTRQRVATGTSGAVTLSGTLGGVGGALILSVLANSVSMISTSMIGPVAVAGVAGAATDTLLGAWAQERRWCPRCQQSTERLTHCDGVSTQHQGGVRRLDNDVVNAVCSLTGACVAAIFALRGI